MFIDNFSFHPHALERILDMAVDAAEVRNCLMFPDKVKPSRKYVDRNLFDGGRITCVVSTDGVVLTVLWRSKRDWKSDLIGAGTYGDREYRENPFA